MGEATKATHEEDKRCPSRSKIRIEDARSEDSECGWASGGPPSGGINIPLEFDPVGAWGKRERHHGKILSCCRLQERRIDRMNDLAES